MVCDGFHVEQEYGNDGREYKNRRLEVEESRLKLLRLKAVSKTSKIMYKTPLSHKRKWGFLFIIGKRFMRCHDRSGGYPLVLGFKISNRFPPSR